MTVTIDSSSGFCWGVVRTVEKAEETLKNHEDKKIYILGQIIHNPKETERLDNKGLITISKDELSQIDAQNSKVLIRAHGEPPETYQMAEQLGINLIDATCPLVTSLQKRVHAYHTDGYQIVIYGKREHAEVIGLRGVCGDECIVVKTVDDVIKNVDFSKKTVLISQTTMDKKTFYMIKETIENHVKDLINENEQITDKFLAKDTLCKAVYGREDRLKEFAAFNDVILFVAGKNSSNGKSLYHVCHAQNPRTYFIEDLKEINYDWFVGIDKIGITGATSTPQWYLTQVKNVIENKFKSFVE